MNNKAGMKEIEQHEREMVDLRSVLRKFKSNLRDNITYDKWMENYSNGVIVDYIKTAPIYHPNLALLFSGEEEAFFLSDQGTILDRNFFKAYYLRGIMKGLKAYKDELHLTPNKRLGSDFERWCETIRRFYCSYDIFISELHFESDVQFKGCRFVKDFFPNRISLLGMEWIGYWSSLTRELEQLIVEVPELDESIKIDNKQNEESYTVNGFDNIIIKNIHELSLSRLLPQAIKNFYMSLSKDGMIPFEGHHNGDNEFYILGENYYSLTSMLRQGILFDENLNQLKHGDLKPYLNEYGKGFLKGYVEYETNLRHQNSIFSITDEQLAYRVFSKVYEPSSRKGGVTFFRESIMGREEMLKDKYNVDDHYMVRNDYFFKNGIEGGEYYKAWEIIMSNPNIFISYFLDVQSSIQPNPHKHLGNSESGPNTDISKVKLKSKELTPFEKFFIKNFNPIKIKKIKGAFEDLESNKQLACLMYLLQSEKEIITIFRHHTSLSRKHFVNSLSGEFNNNVWGVGRYFESGKNSLNFGFDKDDDYIEIKRKLCQIIDE